MDKEQEILHLTDQVKRLGETNLILVDFIVSKGLWDEALDSIKTNKRISNEQKGN